MNKWYPCLLDIEGKKTLVVGGGKVAEKKTLGLLDAGATITVVSPELTFNLHKMHENQQITWVKRGFIAQDMDDAWLVVAATDRLEVQEEISKLAAEKKIFCNRVDKKDLCSFIVPSVLRKGGICVAVSTLGKSPAFAKQIKNKIEQILPDSDQYLELINALREHIKKTYSYAEKDKKMLVLANIEMEGLNSKSAWDKLETWASEQIDSETRKIIQRYRDK